MIVADVHTHTAYGHGKNSVREMFEAGRARGLRVHGFSEHSPRPGGYDYPVEYRDRLSLHFPHYLSEVRDLAAEQTRLGSGLKVLLGLELDWIEDEPEFMAGVLADNDFDYVIGGIHFLGSWGFDARAEDWADFDRDDLDSLYTRYYLTMRRMAESGMFRITAHPDLIKIFSKPSFDAWISDTDNQYIVSKALNAMRGAGMAMELSSAGLRKPCAEIYPGPAIMGLARDLGLDISFASDGHCVHTIGADFDKLAEYAASFGYRESLVFHRGQVSRLPFLP